MLRDSRRAWSIGKLARLTGCNVETIRYYERIGMLPPAPRTAGGHRLYDDAHRRRLAFIRRSRDLGFALDRIRTLLDLADKGPSCGEVHSLVLVHLDQVRARIADLQRMERTLAETAARCAGGTTPDCPIIDALSST